ncbi:MAG: GTP 3',8-cyclase MoaA [Candidatus Electryoneaceae bacterium]|nr:GTP 3',8-cyclase MoaA [Candidatus Electryoneaceae bacterium]
MVNNQLIDPQGRPLTYLRVSVTDRCNFRCSYCYTNNHLAPEDDNILSDDDLLRLINVFVKLGITKVRLTGGEPLLRKNIVNLVERISRIDAINLIGLTTNGYFLKPYLQPLIDAGLIRINISLDTLKRDVFRTLTGYDGLNRVLEAIDSAEKSGAFPFVKVNTLLIKGLNDTEVKNLSTWALDKNIDLRFIEFMPTKRSEWEAGKFIPESDLRDLLHLDLVRDNENEDANSPARSYRVEGYPGRISFISAMSRSFCKTCSRLRLTSDGRLIGCLFGKKDINLTPLLNDNLTVDEIAEYVRDTVASKGFRQIPLEKGAAFQPEMKSVGG